MKSIFYGMLVELVHDLVTRVAFAVSEVCYVPDMFIQVCQSLLRQISFLIIEKETLFHDIPFGP